MNVKLLNKIKAHILAEPKRLFMSDWVIKKRARSKLKLAYGGEKGENVIREREFAKCNTAACIAGWAIVLSKKERAMRNEWPGDLAAQLLGLDEEEADSLFQPEHWPDEFTDGASDDGRKITAEIAAARIDHFIETEGRE